MSPTGWNLIAPICYELRHTINETGNRELPIGPSLRFGQPFRGPVHLVIVDQPDAFTDDDAETAGT